MLTPLVARQLFQTIQKTKKYQLELFFSNVIHVVLSLDNCRTVLSGLLKVPRTETLNAHQKNCNTHTLRIILPLTTYPSKSSHGLSVRN